MILYCVRHGETEFNAQGRIQGQLDTPLSPLGKRQSQAVIAALRGLDIELIYSSPLRRACDLADQAAASLGVELRRLDRLMEINAGVFQGLAWDEIDAVHPEAARKWRSLDPDFRIPQGESRRDLMRRGEQAFGEIRRCGAGRVAVVAHGGLLGAAFKSLLGIPAQFNPFSLLNGSISTLAWDHEVKLLSLNQVEHLNGALGGGGDL